MQESKTARDRRARISVFVARKPFTPFTAKTVKARMRVIDTSSDRWHIGEDFPLSIDFSVIATADSQFAQMIVHQLKAFVARELPHKSPITVFNAMNFIRGFLRSFEFEDLDEESLDEVISDNLLQYIQANRSVGDESNLSVLRYWLRISVCPASCFGIVRPSDLFFVTPHFLTYFRRFSQTFFPLRFAC